MEVSSVLWEGLIWVLYKTSALISVKNVFRLGEYFSGKDGYLLTVEWPVYVFDRALMAIKMGVSLVWYPSKLQPHVRVASLVGLAMGPVTTTPGEMSGKNLWSRAGRTGS